MNVWIGSRLHKIGGEDDLIDMLNEHMGHETAMLVQHFLDKREEKAHDEYEDKLMNLRNQLDALIDRYQN